MDIIEIAKECGAYVVRADDYHFCEDGEAVMAPGQLQQFAQRIEQPHLQRIAELEKDCDILATNYDAARRASQFTADVADQALADLKAAEKQIEQLREDLLKAATELTKSGWNCGNLFDEIDKALEASK